MRWDEPAPTVCARPLDRRATRHPTEPRSLTVQGALTGRVTRPPLRSRAGLPLPAAPSDCFAGALQGPWPGLVGGAALASGAGSSLPCLPLSITTTMVNGAGQPHSRTHSDLTQSGYSAVTVPPVLKLCCPCCREDAAAGHPRRLPPEGQPVRHVLPSRWVYRRPPAAAAEPPRSGVCRLLGAGGRGNKCLSLDPWNYEGFRDSLKRGGIPFFSALLVWHVWQAVPGLQHPYPLR
jgi:hypothetical protein